MPGFSQNPPPGFSAKCTDRKMTALELLGSSDSEAVSEVDFRAMNAETSDDEPSSENSAEDLYSDAASESGESSGSNYESTSSFEKRKAKKAMKMRHGSATSKAAAAGRKQQMHMRKARAFTGTPQSQYLKEKAAPAKQPPKKKAKQAKQNTPTSSDEDTHGSSTETDESVKASAPSKNKNPGKQKEQKPTAEEKAAGAKPRKGSKLPHKVVNEQYEGS